MQAGAATAAGIVGGMARTVVNERILLDPEICSGKPVIAGTRIMVRNILGIVADGGTVAEVLDCYPELSPEDVSAALRYAADVVDAVRSDAVANG